MREIRVHGDAFQRGVQHGRQAGAAIRAFVADRMARVNALRPRPLEPRHVVARCREHAAIVRECLPALDREIRGLAAGAEISADDAYLLQLRRELIAFDRDCSSLAYVDPEAGPVIAQNVDLPGGMAPLATILRVDDPLAPRHCLVTFAGLLGYLGINEAGVAIGINMVLSDDWQVGVPPYLLVRHCLTLTSIDDIIHELQRIPRASSRSFLVADAHEVVNIEMTARELRVLRSPLHVHTNHFLHPELAVHETLDADARARSKTRLERLRSLVDGGALTVDGVGDFLADHGPEGASICAHTDGDLRRGETVASVVLTPGRRSLRALAGHPCQNSYRTFSLS